MTTKTTPTVGDTVHYTDNPVFGGGHARCFDAEVTAVNPDGTIDVREQSPLGPAYAIREGQPGDLYTWHWPEPSEGESLASWAKAEADANAKTNALIHYITGGDFLP